MEKKQYFVNTATQEISQEKYGDNHLIIHASDEEVFKLRKMLDGMHDSDMGAFWRAHVPYMSYHNDKPNDQYDKGLLSVYQFLYELGDDETKKHIESMGVLDL